MASVVSVLSQEKWIRFSNATNKLEGFPILEEASRGMWGSLRLFWELRAV